MAHEQLSTDYDDAEVILEARPDSTHGEYIGNCKWFNPKLGYGFLRICNTELKGTDVFVHHTGLRPLNSSFKTLYKGEYVHFSTTDGRNGKQAINVTGIYGGPLMCDNVTGHSGLFQRPSSTGFLRTHRSQLQVQLQSQPHLHAHQPPPPPPGYPTPTAYMSPNAYQYTSGSIPIEMLRAATRYL